MSKSTRPPLEALTDAAAQLDSICDTLLTRTAGLTGAPSRRVVERARHFANRTLTRVGRTIDAREVDEKYEAAATTIGRELGIACTGIADALLGLAKKYGGGGCPFAPAFAPLLEMFTTLIARFHEAIIHDSDVAARDAREAEIRRYADRRRLIETATTWGQFVRVVANRAAAAAADQGIKIDRAELARRLHRMGLPTLDALVITAGDNGVLYDLREAGGDEGDAVPLNPILEAVEGDLAERAWTL